MYSPPRRGHHRKRISALRLSSDSTVTTLPRYTSPPWQRHSDLPDIPSDQPPGYPDSAEEADEDTDTDESLVYIPTAPPSLPVSPGPRRGQRRSQVPSRSFRRQQSSASDPYLDSLLERSVHALEMSNALLESSISTQTSLSAVLADDAATDRTLDARTRALNSRMKSNRNLHESWMDDLDSISRGLESLVGNEGAEDEFASRSLPTSGFVERVENHQAHHRRSSLNSNPGNSSRLALSTHDRSHFVSPAPRALTVYIDSSEDPALIGLPSTLGVRPTARAPPTPILNDPSPSLPSARSASIPKESSRRAIEVLSSYHNRSTSSLPSTPLLSSVGRRSSTSSSRTARRSRISKSPPPPIAVENPSPSSTFRSRSLTPIRNSPQSRYPRPLTPPIEELSTSSTSSASETLHVERTVDSLRQILEKQHTASQATADKSRATSAASSQPPLPRPSLLSPPTVVPTSGTSTATASISRLFTKPRHTSSTRAPSPPRQSSLKNRSTPSTPLSSTPSVSSPTPSLSDALVGGITRSGPGTPKRISFAEMPEPHTSSNPDKFRASKKAKGKGKAKNGSAKGKDGQDSDESVGWWTAWLAGAAGTASGSGVSAAGRQRAEERFGGGAWGTRPGYGGSLEEWGA